MTIYYYLPGVEVISGGIKQIFRHVKILRQNGMKSEIFCELPSGFNMWFENDDNVVSDISSINPGDYLVLPEISLSKVLKFLKRTRNIVVFNQNCYYTFDIATQGKITPYDYDFIKACIVVSENSREYLANCFPKINVLRVVNGIDDAIFRKKRKKNIITYMPRKNSEHFLQIKNMSERMGFLGDWYFQPINSMTEGQVASCMGESKIYLSTGCPEGCPLPPLEAVFTGNVVIGYTGVGGKEYFDLTSTIQSVEYFHIVEFVNTLQKVIRQFETTPDIVINEIEKTISLFKSVYSLKNEQESVIFAWNKILET